MKFLSLFFVSLIIGGSIVAETNPFKELDKPFKKKSAEILGPFKKELMGTLRKTIGKEGVVRAIEVCQMKAPEIRDKIAQQNKRVEVGGTSYDVSFGRTSHKVRNPENRPKDWMKGYLEKFKKGKREKPAVVFAKDHVRYLEPIKVQPLCLNCHGQNIRPKVRKVLKKRYPKDQATGFKAGDFRGLFWVEYTEI